MRPPIRRRVPSVQPPHISVLTTSFIIFRCVFSVLSARKWAPRERRQLFNTSTARLESTKAHESTAESANTKENEDTKEDEGAKEGESTKEGASPAEYTAVDGFFAQYPDFKYNRSAPVTAEFHSMCDFFGWPELPEKNRKSKKDKKDEKGTDRAGAKAGNVPNHEQGNGSVPPEETEELKAKREEAAEEKLKARRHAEKGYRAALTKQFNSLYGTDVHKLKNWQRLCQLIQIDPMPEEVAACRKAVKNSHINLIDFVDYPRTNERPLVYPTVAKLISYTKRTEKYFPLEQAHAGGVLKYLLRKIHRTMSKKSISRIESPEISK